jgi:hypothetical protein
MDGIEMGKSKAKLAPARACGSERNVSPAITKAKTTSFFIIKETKGMYPRIQESKRGKSLTSKAVVLPSKSAWGFAVRISPVSLNSCILQHPHISRQSIALVIGSQRSLSGVPRSVARAKDQL